MGNVGDSPGLQLVKGLGKDLQMMALPFHGQGEGISGVASPFVLGVPNHPGIHRAELFGFSFGDRPQILQSAADVSGNPEEVEAVTRLGSGDFLKDLGYLREALFQRPVSIGVVFEVGASLTDDGAP